VIPPNHNVSGRIINISESRATLDDNSEVKLPIEWLPLLKTGDIISAKAEGGKTEILLLAPNLTSLQKVLPKINSGTQKKWNDFLKKVNQFFEQRGFSFVHTPTLVKCPGTEPFLDVFTTEFKMGNRTEKYFLPTSPEIHLKKALSTGLRQVFEIKNCFRNGEISKTHQPEFLMLEWYRAYANLEKIQKDTIDLIFELSGREYSIEKVSVAQLFKKYLGKDLKPDTNLQEIKSWALEFGFDQVEKFELWDDVFYLLYVEKIEPQLKTDHPLFVEKYPHSQAAYARIGDDGWAERFEMYWKGLEICNAFHEINDPALQETRMKKDNQLKQSIGKESVDIDFDFLSALETGMPPSAGNALGLERLFMVLNNIDQISDLKAFPYT
jgi:lysyl-tRNA synthetase class 2